MVDFNPFMPTSTYLSGEDAIEIVFLTEDIFQGRVFVVGHANDDGCFSRETG
jgi:hypothetical protein